jgi:hypothetical protein
LHGNFETERVLDLLFEQMNKHSNQIYKHEKLEYARTGGEPFRQAGRMLRAESRLSAKLAMPLKRSAL